MKKGQLIKIWKELKYNLETLELLKQNNIIDTEEDQKRVKHIMEKIEEQIDKTPWE